MGIARRFIGKILGGIRQRKPPPPAPKAPQRPPDPVVEARIAKGQGYLRSIKGIHAGRRGFVVGNGPSLRMADLDRLTGEVSIGSNKVYLAFGETRWRPDYYTIVDDLVWQRIAPELHAHVPRVLIPSYLPEPEGLQVEVVTFRSPGNAANPSKPRGPAFSGDATYGLFGGYTVTFENIQLAVHLGLDPIYLIGCDHFYTGDTGREGDKPVEVGQERNHFLPNYTAPGERMNPALVSRMTRSFERARDYAGQHGIRIINATRGGHLEVFPRTSLDSLFPSDA